MAITKEKKKDILSTLEKKMKDAKITILIEYKGTNVEQTTSLRKEMATQDIEMFVTKKTLIQKVAKDLGVDIDLKSVKKPLAVIFAQDEFLPAKFIHKKNKEIPTIALFGAIFEGKALSTQDVILFATMPSKEESISKLLYLFTYPIRGFMVAVNEIAKKQS